MKPSPSVILFFLATACGDSAPSNPTWATDVEPILVANCVRCHSNPSSGGAPTEFRLDRYDDLTLGGRVERGAFVMAEYLVERAAVVGDMPPVGPGLSDTQKDTLTRWLAMGAPRGDEGDTPLMFIAEESGEVRDGVQSWTADAEWSTYYRIVDPDRGVVDGELFYSSNGAELVVSTGLHEGLGRATWDTTSVADGTYTLLARLFDANREGVAETVALGEVTVAHANDNVAPQVTLVSPGPDELYTTGESLTLVMGVRDPDGGALTREVVAVRGAEEVLLLSDTAQAAPGRVEVPLDLDLIPEGASWHLRVTVIDGDMAATTVRTPAFTVSRSTTELTYDDVEPILEAKCVTCHPDPINVDLGPDDWAYWSGPVYRRVVLTREMPPVSARTLHDITMTDAERATIAEWLLGGAPL